MVKNDAGLVYLEHWNSNPSDYTQPNHNVSIGLVKEEDLPRILAIKTKVCCNNSRPKYHLASEVNVAIWLTGSQP